jgi:hypothetical protein
MEKNAQPRQDFTLALAVLVTGLAAGAAWFGVAGTASAPQPYITCQDANCGRPIKAFARRRCVIDGVVRTDINMSDCHEAKTTGCVRRMLNDQQYASCMAQRVKLPGARVLGN